MMKRVLIADDNVYVRDLVHTFLKGAPDILVCGEATSGAEAIEKAKELQADVVLLDLSMPSMNGVEAASILKRTVPGVRVVMFTLYSDNIPKNAISEMGVDVVLSKTDGIAHLVDSINAAYEAGDGGRAGLNPA
ncbi:MAG TPA: response regulator transcription factor [Candidatus Acidoferrum sp.]